MGSLAVQLQRNTCPVAELRRQTRAGRNIPRFKRLAKCHRDIRLSGIAKTRHIQFSDHANGSRVHADGGRLRRAATGAQTSNSVVAGSTERAG